MSKLECPLCGNEMEYVGYGWVCHSDPETGSCPQLPVLVEKLGYTDADQLDGEVVAAVYAGDYDGAAVLATLGVAGSTLKVASDDIQHVHDWIARYGWTYLDEAVASRKITPWKGGRTAAFPRSRITPDTRRKLDEILNRRGISAADWVTEKIERDWVEPLA